MKRNRILIIDDDREICDEIAEILKDEGYFVDAAFDGLQGKSLMEKETQILELADAIISKPFDVESTLNKISELIG